MEAGRNGNGNVPKSKDLTVYLKNILDKNLSKISKRIWEETFWRSFVEN